MKQANIHNSWWVAACFDYRELNTLIQEANTEPQFSLGSERFISCWRWPSIWTLCWISEGCRTVTKTHQWFSGASKDTIEMGLDFWCLWRFLLPPNAWLLAAQELCELLSEPGATPPLGPPGSTGLLKLQVLLLGAFFSERRVAGWGRRHGEHAIGIWHVGTIFTCKVVDILMIAETFLRLQICVQGSTGASSKPTSPFGAPALLVALAHCEVTLPKSPSKSTCQVGTTSGAEAVPEFTCWIQSSNNLCQATTNGPKTFSTPRSLGLQTYEYTYIHIFFRNCWKLIQVDSPSKLNLQLLVPGWWEPWFWKQS